MNSPLGWTGLSQASYLTAAFAAMLLTVWLADRWRRGKVSSRAVMVGLTLSTLWALVATSMGTDALYTQLLEVARNLGWLGVVYSLFAHDNRHTSVAQVRPVLAVLAMLELFQLVRLVRQLRFRLLQLFPDVLGLVLGIFTLSLSLIVPLLVSFLELVDPPLGKVSRAIAFFLQPLLPIGFDLDDHLVELFTELRSDLSLEPNVLLLLLNQLIL